jgi:hypothetical protein
MGTKAHSPTLFMRLGVAPYVLPFALGVGSCGLGSSADACAEEFYPDAIEIQFQPGATAAGHYRIDFSSPPINGSCDVTVGDTHLAPCTNAHLSIDGKGQDGLVVLSALRVWFDYAPSAFELTLTREGVQVLSESFAPDYLTDEPNGKGCGLRRQSVITVAIPESG